MRVGKLLTLLSLIVILLTLPGCGSSEKNKYVAPPPPEVTVDIPTVQNVTEYVEYTGNTKASEYVEIKSRVEGYLLEIKFVPGYRVQKGDLLFVIDPKPFVAVLNQAKADVEYQQAELKLANVTLKKKESAYKVRAISEIDVLESRANVSKVKAALEKSKQAVVTANLNLSYAYIKAPFTGKIGRNMVDVGNLISSGSMLLTTIVKDNPIYVYFNINEQDLLYFMKHRKQNKVSDNNTNERPTVYIQLANEENYPHKGYLDFIENKVDTGTGTIEMRGVFDNSDYRIIAGLFTKIRIPVAEKKDALLINERALGIDQKGHYLFVVNQENKVEYRTVKVGRTIDGEIVVSDGIKEGERIIVEGILRARPGIEVTPLNVGEESKQKKPTKKQG